MATTFNQAWAKAQCGDYSCLFASEELYGRRYSGKQSGYSRPHRKLTPLEHVQRKTRAEFHASQSRAFNGAFLQPKKLAHNKTIAVLKNTAQNGAYMAPIQLFIEKVSNSYDFSSRIGRTTCKSKKMKCLTASIHGEEADDWISCAEI